MKKHRFLVITILYFVLNIANTYFITTSTLNRYIVSFPHTFLSESSSLLGNFAFLTIFYLAGVLIFKKERKISFYLMGVTFALSIMIIALGYNTKSYRMAFSLYNFSIAKSPTGGFGANVFFDWLYELFVYFRIVSIIPGIVLLVLTIRGKEYFHQEKICIAKKLSASVFIMSALVQFGTYMFYETMLTKNWTYSTDYAQYGVQYAGVYDYYLSEFVFRIDNRKINNKIDSKRTYSQISEFNKNQDTYTNVIDSKAYSNKDKQTGILKGKNVFVIQMESTMSFCFNTKLNGIEITPNFNNLFTDDNCFYFNNVSTTAGMGNTSDAEFAFMTGYYPTGDMTIAWEYYDYDFNMPALGNILSDYESYGYNGTNETFYNHKNLHEGLYGITEFRGLETYESIYSKTAYPERFLNYWISDQSILSWARDTQLEANKRGNKCLSFVETITPHNPFYDLSEEQNNLYCDFLPGNTTKGLYQIYDYDISLQYFQLTNYINQVKFNDIILTEFLSDVTNPNSDHYMPNTVFILYGDHGNAIPKEFFESLYKTSLSDFEYRKLQLNIPVIFYDPSGSIRKTMSDGYSSILSQNKSNTDMFRTVLNLLGASTTANYYGVNMFSGEPTYTYDPKNSDIITDGFIYNNKKEIYQEYIPNTYNPNVVNYALNHRVKNDNYLNSLVYSANRKSYK